MGGILKTLYDYIKEKATLEGNSSRDWQASNPGCEQQHYRAGAANCCLEILGYMQRDPDPTATPNTNLPPLGDGPRRKMLIEIEVTADFEKRLDNQWMVEREVHADRWKWHWGTITALEVFAQHDQSTRIFALESEIEKLKQEIHTIKFPLE